MRYTIKAEKLEVTFQLDDGFIDALLGAVRASKSNKAQPVVYQPTPEEEASSEGDLDPIDEWYDATEVDRTSTAYGHWYAFILMWLVNFDQEGTQPERGEKTRVLAHSRHAGKVVKLVKELGGTTHAVYDVVEAAFKNNESARLDGMSDVDRKKIARHVAENITQVSSILFADLSDSLEYHNPLEEEEV